MELRNAKRYYLQAPAFFAWKDENATPRTGEGVTRDISMQAIFIESAFCPPAGMQVTIDVSLPSLRGMPGVRLRGEGAVLRVDTKFGNRAGFVVATRLHSNNRASADSLLGSYQYEKVH